MGAQHVRQDCGSGGEGSGEIDRHRLGPHRFASADGQGVMADPGACHQNLDRAVQRPSPRHGSPQGRMIGHVNINAHHTGGRLPGARQADHLITFSDEGARNGAAYSS